MIQQRRIMFESVFPESLTKVLDTLCKAFLRDVPIFDEVVIVQKRNIDYFLPMYDYSYRIDALDSAHSEELNQVEIFTNFMKVGQWDFVHTAGGTNFDLIGKICDDKYVCINNTYMNMAEIEEVHGAPYVRQFTHLIETFVTTLHVIMVEHGHA